MKTQMTTDVEQRIGGTFTSYDQVAIEHQARQMRDKFVADALRRGARWLVGRGRAVGNAAPDATRTA